MRLFHFICSLLVFVAAGNLYSQVPGCTDPQAQNYNASATQNDGSCQYATTVLTPSFVLDPLPAGLEESSGLIGWNGEHWTHNDSGDDPIIYKIDPVGGTILQEITLGNASNIDWEDIAQDSMYIYVGEFGNNNGNRTNLRIYRLAKDSIPATGNDTVRVDTIAFAYADQTDFSSLPQNNNFDCEAFFAQEDSLYLFSKNWVDQKTKLYRLPKTPGSYTAELIDSFDVGTLVTGADYNPVSDQAVLIGYDDNGISTKGFLWLLWEFEAGMPFSGHKRPFDYGSVAFAGQVEAIAYVDSFDIRITNEELTVSPFTISAKLHQWNTKSYVTNVMTILEPITPHDEMYVAPHPVTAQSRLFLPAKAGEEVEWSVIDLMGREQMVRKESYQESGLELGILPTGVYVLVARVGQRNFMQRLIW